LVGIEIGDKEHKLIVDEVTFNSSGGVPKGHPFIDREWKVIIIRLINETRSNNKKI